MSRCADLAWLRDQHRWTNATALRWIPLGSITNWNWAVASVLDSDWPQRFVERTAQPHAGAIPSPCDHGTGRATGWSAAVELRNRVDASDVYKVYGIDWPAFDCHIWP